MITVKDRATGETLPLPQYLVNTISKEVQAKRAEDQKVKEIYEEGGIYLECLYEQMIKGARDFFQERIRGANREGGITVLNNKGGGKEKAKFYPLPKAALWATEDI